MAIPGELTGVKENTIQCSECGADLPLQVLHSNAGYYIGRFCDCSGPYSRETSYFKNYESAQKTLDAMFFDHCIRDTDYHGRQS